MSYVVGVRAIVCDTERHESIDVSVRVPALGQHRARVGSKRPRRGIVMALDAVKSNRLWNHPDELGPVAFTDLEELNVSEVRVAEKILEPVDSRRRNVEAVKRLDPRVGRSRRECRRDDTVQ